MREFELDLNSLYDIKEAVFYINHDYPSWRLKEFVDRTNLRTLTITGTLSEKNAHNLMNHLEEECTYSRQSLPERFEYISINDLFRRGNHIQALVFEGTKNIKELYKFTDLCPKYLIGEMPEQGISSFTLWEKFRHCCEHIHVVTLRKDYEPQVLKWDKDKTDGIELSVIFPMYNVEKYLEQCIQSVTAWKADYVEFLFVNDGSPDNSAGIVEEHAKHDSRIKLLDKPNGGCASARQWGLERAKGRYIGFVDPDDFIDESMFRKLLRNAFQGSYDISYCGYKEYYESNGQIQIPVDVIGWPYNKGTTDIQRIQELIAYCRVAIWRGIYKMEMLKKNNIHFYTEIKRFDDLPFKVETFAAARSVISLDENLYYYRLSRPGQDVAADDERLYVHFPIFAHLNESIAGQKNQKLTDYLQLCKLQTHRYALGKIKQEFVTEYISRARDDLNSTGSFLRTSFLIKQMLGKRSMLFYWAIMMKNRFIMRTIK